MPRKLWLAGYFGVGVGFVSVLHTWYAAGVYGDHIRIGLPFAGEIGTSIPVAYAYGLDIVVAVVTFGIAYWYLRTLPPLVVLELEDFLEQGVTVLATAITMVFLPQFSGASWSKATLCGLVVLTGLLVVLSYAYAIPAWEIAAIYLSLVFGGFTIGGEWLAFAEEVSAYRFRPMSYFVLSLTYVIGGSLWLLIGNLTAREGAATGTDPRSDTLGVETRSALEALASPFLDISDASVDALDSSPGVSTSAEPEPDEPAPPTEVGFPCGEGAPDPSSVRTVQDLLFTSYEPIQFDAPAVLCLSPSTHAGRDALRLLCSEAYREKVDETPQMVVIRNPDDAKELSVVDGGVVCFQFPSEEWNRIREDADARRFLWDRINRLANDECSVVVDDPDLQVPEEYYLRHLQFEWRSLPPERLHRIYRCCCGYLPLPDGESRTQDRDRTQNGHLRGSSEPGEESRAGHDPEASETRPSGGTRRFGSIDREGPVYFSQYRDRMIRLLRRYGDEDDGIYRDATAEEPDHESSLHLALKQFVVRYLVDRESFDGSPSQIAVRIQTNVETGGGVADIRVDDEVFEVETLTLADRTTDVVRNQFQHAFTKYRDADIDTVNVVLNPLTAARYLDELVSLCHNHADWCRRTGIDVRFYVPNLEKDALIPLETFILDLQRLDPTR